MSEQDQEVMTYFESDAHSFMVRLWRENGDDSAQSAEWRGWIEHVQSGERRYFQELQALSQIISAFIGEPGFDRLSLRPNLPIEDEPAFRRLNLSSNLPTGGE